ncbi:CAP-Gly domain-containing protein [Wuchereria bancrofti]|uniref:Dynactin subunit 1 n=1 Tax=Wuchereria bancrofti TaxID=6293 RepID=J9EQ17_WUCBA|nr:CAP-Gly domain-containing protein [Wuchereria bancrofti]
MSFKVGVRVDTDRGPGVIEFCGETKFAEGTWIGINLDEPNGKHNGTVKGIQYFACKPSHGIFLRANQIRLESRGKYGSRLPTSVRKNISPALTPSSSTEKLKNLSGTSGLSPKKLYSKEDRKGSAEKSDSQSLLRTAVEDSCSYEKSSATETSYKSDTIPTKSSTVSESENLSRATSVEDIATAESVKNIVKKMEESSLLVARPPNMDERSELEWLRIQHKDLSEKLKTLRIKRKDDYIKLVEYERNRIQLESLLQFRVRIIEEKASLQRKLQEKEKELKDALESKKNENDDITELEERLELIAIEKEVAEEKVDILQTEIEAEKQRSQELEVELELLRNKLEQSGDSSSEACFVQVKQLEQQNEKLREALVRLRDITGQLVIEKQELTKENEKLKDELASLTKMGEKIKENSEEYANIIAELREQVDLAMGSEKMIETLTDINLNMEDKVRALEETIDDFETMRAMDEEILENQKDTEKELREELDKAYGKINELLLQIKACGAQAEDYEKTILMFRKKVSDLNEEIQDRYDDNLHMLEQIKILEEGIAAPGLKSTGFTSTRVFSEIVDAKVQSLELESAHQLIRYLKAFMPDNFMKPGGDNDAVILNVLFPRLYQKSVALAKLMSSKYPAVPGGMRREHVTKSHKAEQWAHCAKFNYLLNAFECILRKFESAIQRCSVERLSRLAQLQLEMATQERMIDQYIDLLKTDRLDENTSSANLEKGITYFQNVFSVHMVSEDYDMKQAFSDFIAQLLSGLGWMKINVQRFTYFLLPGIENSEINILAATLMGLITECEQLTIHSRNSIAAQKEMIINQKVDEHLLSAGNILWKIATVADNVCATASIQLSTYTDVEGLQSERIKELLLGAVEKMNGQTDSAKAQEIIKNDILTLKSILSKLAEQLDSGNLEVEADNKKPFPPLLERAHARKQDAAETEELRWHLEKKENEISDLKKTLRSKADDISNYRLRLEMADKKIETSGKADESRVLSLQSRCDELQSELKRRRDEYEETMDAIQRDLEACEKENIELKERARNMSKKALLMNLSNNLASSGSSLPSTPTATSGSAFTYATEVSILETALIENQNALKFANEKIRYLKVESMLQLLSDTGVSNVSAEIAGPLTLDAAQGSYKEELDKLIREAEGIINEARNYQLPYIANLNKQKKAQLAEEQQYYSNIRDVNYRINNLKLKIHRFWSKYNPGKPLPSLFNNIKSIVVERPKYLQSDGRGVHSDAYKNAYSVLFDKLDVERKKFESQRVC